MEDLIICMHILDVFVFVYVCVYLCVGMPADVGGIKKYLFKLKKQL